jgi:sec-independent protein translocase protein TatB
MNFSETIFLFLLALLVFGPKKLPEIARQVGKALNEFKRASNEFKAQIESEINQLEIQERTKKREAEREELEKTLPPAEPPAGVVHAGMPIAPDESLPNAGSAEGGTPEIHVPDEPRHEEPSSAASHQHEETPEPSAAHDLTSPTHDATNA